jgi:hypothetical protein
MFPFLNETTLILRQSLLTKRQDALLLAPHDKSFELSFVDSKFSLSLIL